MGRLREWLTRSPGVSTEPGVADVEGSSLLAIKRRRAATGGDLQSALYRYADRALFVTSIMSEPGSVILEVGEPSVLPIDAADADLGRCICEHLLQHVRQSPPDLSGRKTSDWAVFRASRDRSATSFRDKSVRVFVETENLVLNLEAAPLVTAHGDICVKGVASQVHTELGATVRRTLAATDVLRRSGLV